MSGGGWWAGGGGYGGGWWVMVGGGGWWREESFIHEPSRYDPTQITKHKIHPILLTTELIRSLIPTLQIIAHLFVYAIMESFIRGTTDSSFFYIFFESHISIFFLFSFAPNKRSLGVIAELLEH